MTGEEKITILIADDHPLFRKGLLQAVRESPRISRVDEAVDGEDALRKVESLLPAIAILDITMPRKTGFDVARSIIERQLPVEVVFLTMHTDEELFNAAMDLGVRGYVLKDSAVSELIDCIETVAAGKHFVSPKISGYLVERTRRMSLLRTSSPGLERLTMMERRVLRLVAAKHTSREIADMLHNSPKTVDTHRANIAKKLGLHGTHSLIKFAIENRSSL